MIAHLQDAPNLVRHAAAADAPSVQSLGHPSDAAGTYR
jgi:hypothetical protein